MPWHICKKKFSSRQRNTCSIFSVVYSDVIKLMAASKVYRPHCGAGECFRMGTVLVSGTITIQQSVHSSVCCQTAPCSSLDSLLTVCYVTLKILKPYNLH